LRLSRRGGGAGRGRPAGAQIRRGAGGVAAGEGAGASGTACAAQRPLGRHRLPQGLDLDVINREAMASEPPGQRNREAVDEAGAAMAAASAAPDGAAAAPPQPQLPTAEELRDLGFGTRVTQQSRQRLLNRDGSFNVFRRGLTFFGRLDAFHALLTMSWRRFFALSFAFYVAVNVVFGFAYALCGPDALTGVPQEQFPARLPGAFFFSVETFTTVGYGNIAPESLAADVLVTLEAFIGLLATALVTGIAFARFARPVASIAFSKSAIISPYRGGAALMFRMINRRRSELSNLEARVVLALAE